MNYRTLIASSNARWNRKILNLYWFVVGLSIVVEGMNLGLSTDNKWHFLFRYMLLPTLALCAVLAAVEVAVRITRRLHDYILLVLSDVIAAILILAHPTVSVIPAIVVLPLLVSVFYLDPKKVMFTAPLAFLTVLVLYFINSDLHASMQPIDLVTLLAILGGGCYICVQVMHRGVDSLARLAESMKTNNDLLIQNILMESASKKDGLTDTYNHVSFHQHLDDLIRQADDQGVDVFLILFDIDNFKQINDTYGHYVGDRILQRVGQDMKRHVGANDFVARYGGEEFAIILVEKTYQQALDIASTIRRSISSMYHEEVQGFVTVSGGMTQYVPHNGKEWLFVTADQLLYRAKHEGKNLVVAEPTR